MRSHTPLPTRTRVGVLVLLIAALSLAACDEPKNLEERAKSLEGGNPLPEAAGDVVFPWIGKQSITCTGEAVERMVATVDFSDKDHAEIGKVQLDGKGGGSGELKLEAKLLRTGDADRDGHLQGPNWIDVETTPDVVLHLDSLQRVKPTVWRVRGTLTLHGITNPVDFLANVRWIGAMDHFADDGVIRVSATVPVDLKAFKVGGAYAGTPAVAAEWQLSVVLLGVMKKK
jgi:polyisoprenoid-binding protein YceI